MMEGNTNRAILLWESWHQKQQMLESVFGSPIAGELDREKYKFLAAGVARISPGASPDEKLVLAMLRKTTSRLEKQLYPSPVLRTLMKLKTFVYDRPIQMARLRQLKINNISALSIAFSRFGIDTDKLALDKNLDFESPTVNIQVSSPYGTDHNFKVDLHLEKDQAGAYELKGYTAELRDTINPEKNRSYRFDTAMMINTREAVNLLQGRAVMKHYRASENQMASKWLQLDFKQVGADGKPLLKEMGADYEFNIRRQLTDVAATLEKWDLTSSRVLDGLEKGNQIALQRSSGETVYLQADAIEKKLSIHDKQQRLVKLETLAAIPKAELVKKTKPKEIKIKRTRDRQQGQSVSMG